MDTAEHGDLTYFRPAVDTDTAEHGDLTYFLPAVDMDTAEHGDLTYFSLLWIWIQLNMGI